MAFQSNKKNSLFKKIILVYLSLIMPFNGFAIEIRNESEYNFNQRAIDLITSENEIMIPNQVFSLYYTDLYSKIQYLNLLNVKYKSFFNDLSSVNDSLISFEEQYKEIISGKGKFSENTLLQLEKIRSKYSFQSLSLPRQISALQKIDEEIRSLENMLENYCEKTSSSLDPQYFSLNPNNNYFDIPIEVKPLHLSPIEAFNEDPHAKAVGWLTFSLTTLAAMAVYCISAGITFAAMLKYLSTNGISFIFEGPAAVIAVIAAVVACAAVSLYSKIQNSHRAEEAKQKERKLYNALKNASELYRSKSLLFHKDEFQQFAFDICKNRNIWDLEILYDDLPDDAKQKIDRSNCKTKNLSQDKNPEYKYLCTIKEENQVNKLTRDLNSFFTDLKNQNLSLLIENVIQSAKLRLDNMEKIISEVESSVVETVSREMIEEHKKNIHSAELLDQAVLYYNTKVKRDFHKKIITDYMNYKDDCHSLEIVINRDLKHLFFLKENILHEFKDEKNQNDNFFASDLEKYVNQYMTTYKSNVENCYAQKNQMQYVKKLLNNPNLNAFLNESTSALGTGPFTHNPNASEIFYDYSDNKTDYFFNMSIINLENLKRIEHGLFSYGLIGGFSKRNDFGVDPLTKANIAALELSKIALNLAHHTSIKNDTHVPPPLHSVGVGQLNLYTNINDNFDTLLQEINQLNLTFSQEPQITDYEKYKEINSAVNFLQSNIKYPRKDLELLISKTRQFKEKFFFNDILYLDFLQKKHVAKFAQTTDSIFNNERSDLINKCLISKFCQSNNTALNSIILMDAYTPKLIYEFKSLFESALSQKNSDQFEDLLKKWTLKIKESTLFKYQNDLFQSHVDFASYEIDNLSQKFTEEYALNKESEKQLNMNLHQIFGY